MEKIKYHIALSNYYLALPLFFDGDLQKKPHIRKCVELPFQQTKAEIWDEVTDTLCNLDFIQAKAVAKMTYDLIKDFNDVLEVIPDNADNISQEKERQARMEKYTRDLIACARGEITRFELEVPESITPWSQDKIDAEIERIKSNPNRLDRLKDFIIFLGQEAEILQNYSIDFNHFARKQAWNYAIEGPVAKAAVKAPVKEFTFLFCRVNNNRPIWNPIPQVIKILKGHTDNVVSVAITPDGKWAISGSYDRTCILWDLRSGEAVKTLIGHTFSVRTVAITPDGKKAISCSFDKTCILWDLEQGVALKILEEHIFILDVAITPDGKQAFLVLEDNSSILWNLETEKVFQILKGHTNKVSSVSITPDRERAVSCSWESTPDGKRSWNGACLLWDLETGRTIQNLEGFRDEVNCVTITPDGTWIIVGSMDGCILWDTRTGKAIETPNGHYGNADNIAITPDGKKAISGSYGQTCIHWDLVTDKVLQILKSHSHGIRSVAITADGKLAVLGSDDHNCILWNLENGKELHTYIGHSSKVNVMAITPNNKQAISGSSDNSCILWDLKTGEAIRIFKKHTRSINALAITPNGKWVVSASDDEKCILWELETGNVLYTFFASHRVKFVAITPDGQQLISISEDSSILWDLETREEVITLKWYVYTARVIVVTPNGRKAISIQEDSTFILWDLETGKVLKKLKRRDSYVRYGLAITPDGKRAVLGSWGTCIVWNICNGKVHKILKGHTEPIEGVAITPDGKRAVSYSEDTTCILWDLRTGKALSTLKGHTRCINVVTVSPDGKRAVSGSEDSSCILWDLETGSQITRFFTNSYISVVSFYSDGVILGCSSGDVVRLNITSELICPGIPVTTTRIIWDHKLKRNLPLSADCPLCGHRFAPPASIVATIARITKKAGLRSKQSPCLELPDEAWEDPGLLGNCPNCGAELKFNPFIAGGDN